MHVHGGMMSRSQDARQNCHVFDFGAFDRTTPSVVQISEMYHLWFLHQLVTFGLMLCFVYKSMYCQIADIVRLPQAIWRYIRNIERAKRASKTPSAGW